VQRSAPMAARRTHDMILRGCARHPKPLPRPGKPPEYLEKTVALARVGLTLVQVISP
jgi:hypothetical protein